MQPWGPGRTGPWGLCPHCPKITVCFFFQSPNLFFFSFSFFLKNKQTKKTQKTNKKTQQNPKIPKKLCGPSIVTLTVPRGGRGA